MLPITYRSETISFILVTVTLIESINDTVQCKRGEGRNLGLSFSPDTQ